MSSEEPRGVAEHPLGAANVTYNLNLQHNEVHGNMMTMANIQHNYFGGYSSKWKPSRRCATIDFDRLSKHFCGRDHDIEQIDNALKAEQGSLRCAVHGISGLGKSHLAIMYGKISYESDKYIHVFWISADTDTKLLNGLESILAKLDHPSQFENDQKAKVEVARRWLEDADKDERWLLILDNARRESFETLRNNLPYKTSYGHILLTTQFEDIAKEFTKSQSNPLSLLPLKPLAVDDGVTLLIASSHLSSEALSQQDRVRARQLVQRTGCHPLAITFAAACATSAGALPELLRQTSVDQLIMITEHEDALADTDQRVIRQFFDRQLASIENEALAKDLFRTLSFLDSSSISIKMLSRGLQHWQAATNDDAPKIESPRTIWRRSIQFVRKRVGHSSNKRATGETLAKVTEEPPLLNCRISDLQKSMQILIRQNLVQTASSGAVSMHDLTNHMSHMSMGDPKVTSRYQAYACRLIYLAFVNIENPTHPENWLVSDEVISHVFKLSADTSTNNSDLDVTLSRAASYLDDRGRYADSRILYDRLVIMRKRNLGSTHPDTLAAMHQLAGVYQSQGEFREAEELFQRVVDEKKKQLGPTHPSTLTTMHNLALIYQSKGQFREAEELFQHVLDEEKKQLGPTHPNTLNTAHNLASVYELQGQFREAEELYQHVLDEKKKHFGPTHPSTLNTAHNLAGVYESQSQFREAEELFLHVLNEEKRQLGPSHPSTLTTMHNLAVIYKSQSQLREAEELFQHVLTEEEKQLGPTHPTVLTTMANLAGVYESQGQYQEAEEIYQHVLAERKKHLGPSHPSTLTTMHNLAGVYESQSQFREAEGLFLHVLNEEKKQLGPTHPDTLTTMANLAGVFESQGQFREAQELYQHVLDEKKKQLGPSHLKTLTTMHNLAGVHESQGQFREAEELYQHVLTEEKNQLGPTHPETLQTAQHLAGVYKSQDQFREAEELFQWVLDEQKEQFGPTHPDTLITMANLASIYKSQGQFREAEVLLMEALAGLAGREEASDPDQD